MDFKCWLEAINVPPHMPEKWLEDTLYQAKHLESKFRNKKEIIDNIKQLEQEVGFDGPTEVIRSLPYGIFAQEDGFLSDAINDYYRSRQYGYHNLTALLQRFNVIETNRWEAYIPKFIDAYSRYFRKGHSTWEDRNDKVVSHYEYAIKDARDYPYAVNALKETKEVLDSFFEYINLIKKTKRAVDAFNERRNLVSSGTWNDRPTAPNHRPIEVLYHATPKMHEILSNGFKTKEQVGTEILGGDTSGGISFTADLKIARAIKMALIDVINIAHGKMKVGDIMKLGGGEGLPKSAWGDWVRTVRYDRRTDLRQKTFDLYKQYLSKTKLRYNPFFFGVTIENFMGLDVDNCGVLACQVDMTKSVRYLESMEEFRIPIDAIKRIVKVVN